MKTYRLIEASGEIRNQGIPTREDIFDALFGIDSDPVEIGRFYEKAEAMEELSHRKCKVWESGNVWRVSGFAVETFDADDDGEFLTGSDYDMAEISD